MVRLIEFVYLRFVIFQDAEAAGFTSEDLQIAKALCGDANPVSKKGDPLVANEKNNQFGQIWVGLGKI